MAGWALFVAGVALALSVARWILDYFFGVPPFKRRGERHETAQLRVELLASGTNCFVIRGGSTLLFLSLRVYNESPQRSATVTRVRARVRHHRAWETVQPYPAEQAPIFQSLVRNAMPAEIPSSSYLDFYEVYQLPDLLSRTTARIRLEVFDYLGATSVIEDNLSLRLDTRPPLDILFQTLDI
jgi:hypothetical protein